MQSSSIKEFNFDFCVSTQFSVLFWSRLMTCSFHVSLLFNLSINLLSELMILSSALMNSRFVADFDLRERENFQFSIFNLRRSHLWSYWVEWELVLIIQFCSITCRLIWYIICFNRSLSILMMCFIFALIWIVFFTSNIFLLNLVHDAQMTKSRENTLICLLLNIKEAFDHVTLKQLIKILIKLKISINLINWVKCFL